MSENAQAIKKTPPVASEGLWVRSALLAGPARSLIDERTRTGLRLTDELTQVRYEGPAETLIHADVYLDGLQRLEALGTEAGFSFRSGLTQDIKEMGLFGTSVVHAQTLWDAFQATQLGMSYVQSASKVRFSFRLGRCRVHYLHPFGDGPEASLDIQYTMGLFVNLLRQAVWFPQADLRMTFPGATTRHHAMVPEALEVKNGPLAMLEFNDLLTRSPMQRSELLIAAVTLAAVADFKVDSHDEPTLSEIVVSLQTAALRETSQPLSLQMTSQISSVPSRSLQAALKSEGSGFAELRDNVRHKLAREALLVGKSIEETAALVGYSQRQSFSEAFSNWEGIPPSVFASSGHSKCARR